jgi:hypothetical protein
MRRVWFFSPILVVILLALLLIAVFPAQAESLRQDPTPTAPPEDETPPPDDEAAAETDATPIPDDAVRVTFTLAEIGLGNLPLNGMFNLNSYWIPLPPNWSVVSDVQVDLGYKASQLLNEERAALTIMSNEEIITSIHPFADGHEHRLSFTIPVNQLYSSGFSLDFDAYLRMTTDVCEEHNNPGQWMNILDNTAITFFIRETTAPPDLRNTLQALVLQNTLMSPPPLVFVVPDNADAVALTAAANVAARLGHQNRGLSLPLQVETPATLTEDLLATANLVVVGLPADQPLIADMANALPAPLGADGFVTEDGLAAPAEHGVIQIFNSPWNPTRNVLLVSGGEAAGLALAGEAFARRGAFETLTGSFQFVESVDVVSEMPPTGPWLGEQTTFAQLGQNERMVQGLGTFTVNYAFREPAGWALEAGAELALNLAYSPALEEGSHVAVFLNDELIGTAHTGGTSGQTEFKFSLPVEQINQTADGRRPQTLRVRLSVTNIILTQACEFVDPETAWVRVLPDSYFVTPHTFVPAPDLEAFPYPFVDVDSDVPVAIVLPAEPTVAEMAAGLSVAATLGNYAFSDFNLSLTPEASAETFGDANLIILGETERQPLIEEFLATMPTVPDVGLYQALENNDTGVLRVDVSPWNAERVALLAYGQTAVGFERAVQALYNAAPPVLEPALIALVEVDGQPPRVVYRSVAGGETEGNMETETPAEGGGE